MAIRYQSVLSIISLCLSLFTGSVYAENTDTSCTKAVQRETVSALASFAEQSITASLVYVDVETATTGMQHFSKVPWIRFAYLFDNEKQLFAHYVAEGEAAEQAEQTALNAFSSVEAVELTFKHVIELKREDGSMATLGTLILGYR